MKVLVLLCVVLIVSPCLVSASSSSWNFLLYVCQWPGTAQEEPVSSNINTFTLHGVWPTNNDTTYPSDCDGPSFSLDEIDSLIPQLNSSWPSFQGSYEDFWSHEWEKHGTCAMNGEAPYITDEYTFFSFALGLHSKYDTLSVWANAGITPSSSKKYKISDLTGPIKEAFGASPIITCQDEQIATIEYCVDNTGTAFECAHEFYEKSDSSAGCSSSDSYYLPPIKYRS